MNLLNLKKMKLYFKSILAINIGMLILSTISITTTQNTLIILGSIAFTIFWCVNLYKNILSYINDEKQSILNEVEEPKIEEQPKDVLSSESIYTQLNGLTKDEILWLYEHVENQKTSLIDVNTNRRENLVGVLNMFNETKGLEHLYEDARKDLDAWDEFYLEHSSMVARILPKIELLKEAVS